MSVTSAERWGRRNVGVRRCRTRKIKPRTSATLSGSVWKDFATASMGLAE